LARKTIKTIKELKEETACKREVKMMIKEVVREELRNIKQKLEDLRRMIQREAGGPVEGFQRSYNEAVKEKKKENIIIIKPKIQQERETTKKLIKEKIDIKNMATGVTKLKKGSKETVIMNCEREEIKKLKETVQAKMGKNYNVMETSQSKPKIKIINIGLEEKYIDDNELINMIKKQNKIDVVNMRIVKRMVKEKRNNQSERRRNEQGSIITEIDARADIEESKTKCRIEEMSCI